MLGKLYNCFIQNKHFEKMFEYESSVIFPSDSHVALLNSLIKFYVDTVQPTDVIKIPYIKHVIDTHL